MERILVFGLVCPFWASFRMPSSVNVHITFPFPPPTTLYGLLNAARGKPQDWDDDRDAWQFSVVVESQGTLVESFSKVLKIYEDKRSREQQEADLYGKGVFDRTTLIRQKRIQPSYRVYAKAEPALLEEACHALCSPHWPLYLGESDDVVDVVLPRIAEATREALYHAHSILPGIREGCQLLNVPVCFYSSGKRWSCDYQLYSLPPDLRGVHLQEPAEGYNIDSLGVVFNDT